MCPFSLCAHIRALFGPGSDSLLAAGGCELVGLVGVQRCGADLAVVTATVPLAVVDPVLRLCHPAPLGWFRIPFLRLLRPVLVVALSFSRVRPRVTCPSTSRRIRRPLP